MRFLQFLKVCSPEELAAYELSFERAKNRVRADMDHNEFMDHPDLFIEREIIIDTIAGLRLQLANAGHNGRIAFQKEIILKEGLDKMAKLALHNADAVEYWKRLAISYEEKMKS